MSKEQSEFYAVSLTGSFWDAVEIATIRFVSYWDRLGQPFICLLQHSQIERDGFPLS